jgi:hypothetical protein
MSSPYRTQSYINGRWAVIEVATGKEVDEFHTPTAKSDARASCALANLAFAAGAASAEADARVLVREMDHARALLTPQGCLIQPLDGRERAFRQRTYRKTRSATDSSAVLDRYKEKNP